jgi:hypothetical protein
VPAAIINVVLADLWSQVERGPASLPEFTLAEFWELLGGTSPGDHDTLGWSRVHGQVFRGLELAIQARHFHRGFLRNYRLSGQGRLAMITLRVRKAI